MFDLSISYVHSPDVLRKANGELIVGDDAAKKADIYDQFTRGGGKMFVVEYKEHVGNQIVKRTLMSRTPPEKYDSVESLVKSLPNWPHTEKSEVFAIHPF